MKLRTIFATLAIFTLASGVAFAAVHFSVRPGEYDPGKTFLVQAQWLNGTGCPTSAKTQLYNPDGSTSPGTLADTGCPTGDPDHQNQGLLLAKTGPTANNASAFAELKGVKGIVVTELGYDLRKQSTAASLSGSHCGAGAPRFNVETTTAFYFIGCNSPPATMTAASTGWIRLRWGGTVALMGYNASTGTLETVNGTVKSITIIFDEGQDAGGAPDTFGLAVLDNIDVNGTLVGRGDSNGDKGNDHGDNNGNNDDEKGDRD